jgi:hypothetical protein
MSDGFTPAKTGLDPLPVSPGGGMEERTGPVANKGPPPAIVAPPDPMMYVAGIADDIVAGFRHLAEQIPSAQPLLRMAQSIEARLLILRKLTDPPPPDGPQPDHS